MTVLVVYPDAGSGSTTVDGSITNDDNYPAGEWFTTVNGASSGTSVSVSDSYLKLFETFCGNISNKFTAISRSILTFDTSTIGTGKTISDVTISFYIYSNTANLGSGTSLCVVAASPSSDNDLVVGDFSSLSSTAFSTKSQGDITTGEYNVLSFNSAGISSIDVSGVSGFGTLDEDDRTDTAPTWVSSNRNNCYARAADQIGTTQDPKLTITYAPTVSTPTVTTQAVTSIEDTTATLNGNITATGGANATVRGFYYKQASSGDPTAADSTISSSGSFGTGAYTETPTGLTDDSDYRVAAFATNSAGTTIGSTVGFTTESSTIEKVFTETLSLSSKLTQQVAKTISETLSLVLSTTIVEKMVAILIETLSLTDTIMKQMSWVFTETLSLADSISKRAYVYLTETLSLALSTTIVAKLVAIFLEALKLTPKIRITLNGLIPDIWTKALKKVTIWTKQPKT